MSDVHRNLIFRNGCSELGINSGDPVPATDKFISKAQKVWFRNAPMNKIRKFSVENVPSRVQTKMDAEGATGSTQPLSINNKIIDLVDVYFNKNLAFTSAKTLFYSMGHEFMHVSQFSALAGQPASLLDKPGFYDLLDYQARNYEIQLGNTCPGNPYDLGQFVNSFPTYFKTLNWFNFQWTDNHLFIYPF
jgi:hypothetical protein